jgi:hypothetical protein
LHQGLGQSAGISAKPWKKYRDNKGKYNELNAILPSPIMKVKKAWQEPDSPRRGSCALWVSDDSREDHLPMNRGFYSVLFILHASRFATN